MTVKVLGIAEDPDTEKAINALHAANISFQLVDVVSTGIVGFLARDLDVHRVPVVLSWNCKFEGLDAIEAFAKEAK